MICQNCGAHNRESATQCRNCQQAFMPHVSGNKTTKTIFQTPLRQASEPNISTFDDEHSAHHSHDFSQAMDQEINDNTIPLYYQSAPFKQRVDIETVDTKIIERPSATKSRMLWSTVAFLSIVILAMIAFRFIPENQTGASLMYVEAEKIYQSGNYTASLVMFQQYLREYPEDDLAAMAKQRITEIKTRLQSIKNQQTMQLVMGLMSKAQKAFEQQHYLVPEDDNVIHYTSEVLKIAPSNSEAIDMRARIVKYYQDQAEKALKRRRFKTAGRYFENILKIIPDDQNTLRQLEKLNK